MEYIVMEFWTAVGLTLLAILIPLIIVCVIQFLLTRFISVKAGSIFMIISFIVVTVLVIISMANGFKVTKTPIGETSYGDETLEEEIIKIYVIDGQGTDSVEFFSDLEIKNKKTKEVTYIPLEFDGLGKLVGDEEALSYSEEINRLVSSNSMLVGESLTTKEMKRAFIDKHGSYTDEVIILALLIYLISIAQFIVYRKTKKHVETKRYINEIDKMRIQDL